MALLAFRKPAKSLSYVPDHHWPTFPAPELAYFLAGRNSSCMVLVLGPVCTGFWTHPLRWKQGPRLKKVFGGLVGAGGGSLSCRMNRA
jgi:hypothetical protein